MAARHRFSAQKATDSSSGWSFTQTLTSYTGQLTGGSFEPPPLNHSLLVEDEEEEPEQIIMANSSRDRTNEFASVLKSMKSRQQSNGTTPSGNVNNAIQTRSEFSRQTKRIGQDLSKTYEKLEKLTILCKKKTLFDDRPVEIQELTYIIKQDITSLKRKITHLEELKTQQAIGKKDAQRHNTSLVKTLRSKLATMSDNFKHVLENRRENMKHQKERKDQFSSSTVSSASPLTSARNPRDSILLMDEQRSSAASSSGGAVAISMDSGGPSTSHQQMSSMELVDQRDAYITERASTMETIESTIVELGNIFQQLATMVKEQEEQVMRIDSNVETSELNIEAAHGEILKYFQGITSNRWLMVKIFLLLIVFFVVFVVFFA